jgi:hypothetical protein
MFNIGGAESEAISVRVGVCPFWRTSKPVNLSRLRQGNLYGFCGVYVVLNALQLQMPAAHRLIEVGAFLLGTGATPPPP